MRGGRGGGKEGNSLREIALKCKEGGGRGKDSLKEGRSIGGKGSGVGKGYSGRD